MNRAQEPRLRGGSFVAVALYATAGLGGGWAVSNTMTLPNRVNVVYVTQYVACLHLNDVTNGDLRLLSIRPLDGNVPFPGVGYLVQQLDYVATVGAK